ncbi:MAG: AAA family ATPase [Candidatus Woesearchaeota archaeon]|nr:AAA family ATPase [Candidatus Woesearchaeota archaeon]
MKKTKTGIPGFDKLVDGGFPNGSVILVCGTPGTAKSLFSMQFSYNGSKMYDETSMYISFEQSKEDMVNQAKQFGWHLEELIAKGKLILRSIPVEDINHLTFEQIVQEAKEKKVKRIVIDSLSTFSINAPVYYAIYDLFLRDMITQDSVFSPPITEEFLLKRFIYYLIGKLKKLGVTSILISEIGNDSSFLSRDTVSEFMSDGIIQMFFESMGGQYSRSLLVRKMRHVKNDEDIHPVEISSKGLVIHDIK